MPRVFLPATEWAASRNLGADVFVVDENQIPGAWCGAGYAPIANNVVYVGSWAGKPSDGERVIFGVLASVSLW